MEFFLSVCPLRLFPSTTTSSSSRDLYIALLTHELASRLILTILHFFSLSFSCTSVLICALFYAIQIQLTRVLNLVVRLLRSKEESLRVDVCLEKTMTVGLSKWFLLIVNWVFMSGNHEQGLKLCVYQSLLASLLIAHLKSNNYY